MEFGAELIIVLQGDTFDFVMTHRQITIKVSQLQLYPINVYA